MLHDSVGYTPYEGRPVTGWPVTVISRGRVVVEDGRLLPRAAAANSCRARYRGREAGAATRCPEARVADRREGPQRRTRVGRTH